MVQLTDASQNVAAAYAYDSWGNSEGASGSEASQPYRWSTKRLHVDSGLYDYGYRFYSPSLRGWISRDPLGEAGGANLFAFVGNNPVNRVDPLGLCDSDDFEPPFEDLLYLETTETLTEGPALFEPWSVNKPVGWPTRNGTPSWTTVYRRHWKNRAYNAEPDEFSPENIARMERGRAPQFYNENTGRMESMELHHNPAQRNGGLTEFQEVTPEQHAELDPMRRLGSPSEGSSVVAEGATESAGEVAGEVAGESVVEGLAADAVEILPFLFLRTKISHEEHAAKS